MFNPPKTPGLDKVPFYSPFASEITIWRVTFHTHSPFGEQRIQSQIQFFFLFLFPLFSFFQLLIYSSLLFSLFNWPHLKRLIHTYYNSFYLGYDGRNKKTKAMASKIWKRRVQLLISSPFGALILKTFYRPEDKARQDNESEGKIRKVKARQDSAMQRKASQGMFFERTLLF